MAVFGSMALAFTKMHGLGNDFVVVDRRDERSPVPESVAVALCDRRRGIGADGVLSILPATRAPLAMHVTNSDGSHAEMCGNGLRCVVRWAVDGGLLPKSGGDVETDRGVLACVVRPNGDIQVDMGAADLLPARIPVAAPGDRFVDQPLDVGDVHLRVTAVSMGNPHAVAFVEGDLTALASRLGPLVEVLPLFPNRTNVEFAQQRGESAIELVVWERGAGLTQACGTGACATAVAAVLTGRAAPDRDLAVQLPGGVLQVRVSADFSRILMTGPAVEVFRGRAGVP